MRTLPLSKEDFIDSVLASVPLERMKIYVENTNNRRFHTLMLEVMVWSINRKNSTNNQLYLYFREAAAAMKMSVEDRLVPKEKEAVLFQLETEALLSLLYDVAQNTELPQEVTVYLKQAEV